VNITSGSGREDLLTIDLPMSADVVTFDADGHGTDPGSDSVLFVGTSENDNVFVSSPIAVDDSATRSPFEINGVEFVVARGDAGFDDLINETNAAGLLEGQDGNDIHVGGSIIDVIAAGAGADYLAGQAGDDFLFADVELDSASSGTLILDPPGLGDFLDGGTGTNSGAQIGALDRVHNITGKFVDGGACKNVLTWLLAQIIVLELDHDGTSPQVNALIADAFNELEAIGFPAGLEPGAMAASAQAVLAVSQEVMALPEITLEPTGQGGRTNPAVGDAAGRMEEDLAFARLADRVFSRHSDWRAARSLRWRHDAQRAGLSEAPLQIGSHWRRSRLTPAG
jgi:Ca2+-binding RTX toxin-like protein